MKNSLEELRRRSGLTQDVLARQLGTSRQTIVSIERQRFTPSLPLAFRIAAVFDCPIEDIFVPDDGEAADPPRRDQGT